MADPTTWEFANGSVVLNPKATEPSDIAMTIHADSIVRNGKPLTGRVVNLTRAHLADPTFSIKVNDKTRAITVVRTEGARGRKARQGATADAVSAFLASLNQ